MLAIWWRSILAKWNLLKSCSGKRRRPKGERLSSYRVWFEVLEDRFAPAGTADNWIGATTGSATWNNTANWSTGALPTTANDATFAAGTYTVTLDAAAPNVAGLVFNSGANVTIASGSATNTLTLNGDGISATGATGTTDTISACVTVAAAQSWTVGTSNALSVSGNVAIGTYTLTANGTGQITISGVVSGTGGITANNGLGGTLTLAPATRIPARLLSPAMQPSRRLLTTHWETALFICKGPE